MKKSVIALGLAACAALSGEVAAKPVAVSFSGVMSSIKNDDNTKISVGEKQFFSTVIDFEKCTITINGEETKGSTCFPDSYINVVSDHMGPVPYTAQTWVYASPDGTFIYTYQVSHGWETSIFRGNGYNVKH